MDNVTPRQAWEALLANADARLVDVRTQAEWQVIGLPDLDRTGKPPVLISWQSPAGVVHPDFAGALRQAGLSPDQDVYFLCRSGVRSAAAAQAADAAGFRACHNIAYGFEGHPDEEGQRGRVNGWQAGRVALAAVKDAGLF